MSSRKLAKADWQAYCDRVSRSLRGKQAEVEVNSLAIGHQVEVDWLPVHGITYDPKADVFEVVMEGVDHLIPHPCELHVDEGAGGLEMLEIVDADAVRQIVRLREPLKLPSPTTR